MHRNAVALAIAAQRSRDVCAASPPDEKGSVTALMKRPLTLGLFALAIVVFLTPVIAQAFQPAYRPAPDEQPESVTSRFRVAESSSSRSVVTLTSDGGSDAWSLWKWPVAAGLAMIVLLVCSLQYQALQNLRRREAAQSRLS